MRLLWEDFPGAGALAAFPEMVAYSLSGLLLDSVLVCEVDDPGLGARPAFVERYAREAADAADTTRRTRTEDTEVDVAAGAFLARAGCSAGL